MLPTLRRQTVGDEDRPRGSDDVDRRRAQAVADEQCRAPAPAAPSSGCPEGDRRVVGDDPLDLDGRRERHRRQREQRLGVGQSPTVSRPVRSPALALVAGCGAEHIEGALGFLGGLCRHRAPPPPRDEAHRGLDRTLAVAPPGRTRLDHGPVVLGDRSEGGLHVAGSRQITVASRSVRHTRAVPPRRRITASMASIRWAWSIFSASTPRTLHECGRVPNST